MTERTVALITPLEKKGGVATYASKLIDSLSAANVRVVPIRIENPDSMNPFGFLDLVSAIPDDVDIVHVQFEAALFGRLGMTGIGAPAFFIAINRVSAPVVTTLHEVHRQHTHRGTVGNHLLRFRDWAIERLAAYASDTLIVHTREAEQVLRERHGPLEVERMLHPVEDDADILPAQKAKSSVGVEGPMALTFGWVEPKKRYKEVVELLPEFPSLTYIIAGGVRIDENREIIDNVFEYAERLDVRNQIKYIGYLEEAQIDTVFSAADTVVVPYDRVSQSGVVNDALAYRRPVITSRLSAFEELRDEYGCLLTYESQPELREHLKAVLNDEEVRTRLVEQTNRYIDEQNWERFGERTAEFYERFLQTT